MSRETDILDRSRAAVAQRDPWLPLWQELSDILHPARGGFTREILAGRENTIDIYDSTPMQARRGLATAIDGLMKPASAKWFWLRASDEDLNDIDEVKAWFDECQARMWSAIYNPASRFIPQSSAVDNDLASFGLGYLWIAENKNRNGLLFRALHIADVAFGENEDGQIDCAYVSRKLTAPQAASRFGEDNLPDKIKEVIREGNAKRLVNEKFEFIQAIEARKEYDPQRYDNKNFPFGNVIVSVTEEKIVEENGFQEFPLAAPRWEVSAGQMYPRSPGMVALPDARTLQTMGHTLLVGGQRAVDPPVWAVDDGVFSAVRTFPGGLTTVSAEAVKATGGHPLGQLTMGANIPIGREMQADYRNMVEAAFFKNVFNLPIDGPQMTATEVIERKEEFIRTIGPVLGQLESDYPAVIINRVFGIMSGPMRDFVGAALPPPPDVLRGRNVTFQFQSPIQQARKKLEVAGLQQAMEYLAPIIQSQPETVDNIDGDEIVRDVPDVFSLPHKWIRSLDAVQQIRTQRSQVQQGAGALQQGQQVADILKTVTDAHGTAAATQQAAQAPAV